MRSTRRLSTQRRKTVRSRTGGEPIERLVIHIQSIRDELTKTFEAIQDGIQLQDNAKLAEAFRDLTDLSERLKEVESKWSPLVPVDEFAEEIQGSLQFAKEINSWRTRAEEALGELRQQNSNNKRLINEPVKVKLPKLEIPKFYGNLDQWINFWSLFESSIHSNDCLNNVDKFAYLKAHLGGMALSTIEGLLITSENYFSAIAILQERFGSKNMLITTHMNNLLAIPPLRNSNDITSFRKLYDHLNAQMRSLESLEIQSDNYGTILLPLVLRLLPHDLLIDFHKRQHTERLEDLIAFLSQELSARESALVYLNRESVSKERNRLSNTSSNFHSRGNFNRSNNMEKDKIRRYETSTDLSNQELSSVVYMQSLLICVSNGNSKRTVRAIIDTGSSRSYISRFVAEALKLKSKKEETVKHGFFGGAKSIIKHKIYSTCLKSLDRKYSIEVELRDQAKICERIPRIKNDLCKQELKRQGIFLSDISPERKNCLYKSHDSEIHLLLGSDIAGMLFTGDVKHLDCGLSAVGTKFGWTVIGKLYQKEQDSSLLITSQPVYNTNISDSRHSLARRSTDHNSWRSSFGNERPRSNFSKDFGSRPYQRYSRQNPYNRFRSTQSLDGKIREERFLQEKERRGMEANRMMFLARKQKEEHLKLEREKEKLRMERKVLERERAKIRGLESEKKVLNLEREKKEVKRHGTFSSRAELELPSSSFSSSNLNRKFIKWKDKAEDNLPQ